ncbi:putative immunity protein [Rhodococcus sp. NPDC049939]|uniref:putative immunity protein n=1 Tax=Rhodococcus sp. NPDC049939 TaxID=3155511 RepID=UPI0033E0F745
MTNESSEIDLSKQELREVAGYAAECARHVLPIFESNRPADPRCREAVYAAAMFASGGQRSKSLRDSAWAANKAAREVDAAAARHAARAAAHAAAAAYLHPLADAHQVKHILGAGAHAARAVELSVSDNERAGAENLEHARLRATSTVVAVLERYPAAPLGGGRVGELLRDLDASLRR